MYNRQGRGLSLGNNKTKMFLSLGHQQQVFKELKIFVWNEEDVKKFGLTTNNLFTLLYCWSCCICVTFFKIQFAFIYSCDEQLKE